MNRASQEIYSSPSPVLRLSPLPTLCWRWAWLWQQMQADSPEHASSGGSPGERFEPGVQVNEGKRLQTGALVKAAFDGAGPAKRPAAVSPGSFVCCAAFYSFPRDLSTRGTVCKANAKPQSKPLSPTPSSREAVNPRTLTGCPQG